ncbi:NUDIX hydrolase [Alicyclobacillus fodiniaquatilis]|uniref:NUDIX hydrolase n=1 Tax=Alicyclobacillus fodiniaquatilis TaxID=1661150 RepID=A0ABW4JJB6_9BACL
MDELQWLKWAQQIQSIAQSGLTYGKDVFDLERYTHLQTLAAEMLAAHTEMQKEDIQAILSLESGYPTPKTDIRAVVFDDDRRILMARETSDGRWSLPGGWADIGESVGEIAVREVEEETGYKVKPVKMLAVWDRQKHPHPPMFWHVYKLFIRCERIGGSPKTSIETDAIGFYAEDGLPPLSVDRVTKAQIHRMFQHHDAPHLATDFD